MKTEIEELYVKFINLFVCWWAPQDFDDVLILRLDELGDFVLWLDSAKAYKSIFPNKRITLLVNEKWIDLAKEFNYWDEVIGLDTFKFRFNPIYRIKYLNFIRSKNFETTVCPRYFIQQLLEPGIIAACGSERKIVYGAYFPPASDIQRIKPRDGTVHEIIRNADFVRDLGAKDFKASIPDLGVPQIHRKNLCKNIVICPNTLRKDKEWPLKNFIKIMHNLYGHQIVVVSDRRLKDLPSHVHNVTGRTKLIQFINLINNATLVIGNDSACIHLAAALNVPSLCIGVGKHKSMFQPYFYEKAREGQVVPRVIWNLNVNSITVKEVWDIVKDML